MNVRHFGLICVSVGLLCAAPALGRDSMKGGAASATTFHFTSENGSAESGTVTLTPKGPKATAVTIALTSAPNAAQPAHIHKGACPKVGAVAYPLENVVGGKSTTTVQAPLATLTGGGFAVNVHKSTSDLSTYVACADLSNPKAAMPAASSAPSP